MGFGFYDLMHFSTVEVCIVLRCCDIDSGVGGLVLIFGQEKRCCEMCSLALQSEHIGEG